MELLIITGMSGAGKSTALKHLEDIGYFCIDNMPLALIPKFAELVRVADEVEKAAIGVDIRGGRFFDDFEPSLLNPQAGMPEYRIVFLDSSDEVLENRYKETRRKHPLSQGDRVIEGIERERERLSKIKSFAHHIIDTGYLAPRQLKEKINLLFLENKNFDSLTVTVLSFGYKYGVPRDSDFLLDVRFLPNPFYDPQMTNLTGNDAAVRDFVLGAEDTAEFLQKTTDLIDFLMPRYVQEGKNKLVLSIGCTGGKHRSVAIVNYLSQYLTQAGYFARVKHRDIGVY